MGRDKALLAYTGSETQLERTAGLLQAVCTRTFVSLRREQRFPIPSGVAPLFDALDDVHGPLRGILSAMNEFPEADWLVLACDLPKLQIATLEKLIASYRALPEPQLLAYRSHHDGLPEPLCAIYPAGQAAALHQLAQELGKSCPRKLLILKNAALIELEDPESLDNINTPEELAAVRNR